MEQAEVVEELLLLWSSSNSPNSKEALHHEVSPAPSDRDLAKSHSKSEIETLEIWAHPLKSLDQLTPGRPDLSQMVSGLAEAQSG